MPAFLTPFLVCAIAVLAGEAILWALFRRRIRGLKLPTSHDASSVRLDTAKLGLLPVVHTLLLLLILFLAFFFLW
jgi:hypothetical protein